MRYVLPGMGATSAMYAGPWRSLSDTEFLDWSEIVGEVNLARIADVLIDACEIQPTDELVGSSLGGIVALEIAERIRTERVVLVGSARRRDEIRRVLTALATLAAVTPIRFIHALAGKSGGDLGQMFADVDAAFIRGACRALGAGRHPHAPTRRSAGFTARSISSIPCPPDATALQGGGHLIAMTHPAECVAFLTTCWTNERAGQRPAPTPGSS